MSKESIRGDNIFQPKAIISNEETISNNYDINPTVLEEDIGHILHDIISFQVYDIECKCKRIDEPNNAHIKSAITFQNKISLGLLQLIEQETFVLYIQHLRYMIQNNTYLNPFE